MKQNKNTLAKLLAAENVTVQHRQVSTAYFELNTRTIVLPIWQEMSNDLYDMLLGHEVGHALFTPEGGWHSNQDYGKNFKTYLNVVEDARIERKVKQKFPGIVKNFYGGYQELFDRDFFGVKDRDVNSLPLIDRINLHYKVGSMLHIQFSDAEQAFLDRIDVVEDWDGVVSICKELFDHATNDEKEKNALQELIEELKETESEDLPTDGPDFEIDAEESEEEDENEDFDDYLTTPPKDDKEEIESEEEETKTGDGKGEDNDTPFDMDQPVSITDQNFRENEDEFIDRDSLPLKYVTMPSKIDTDFFVTNIDELLNTKWDRDAYKRIDADSKETIVPIEDAKNILFRKFEQKNKAYISALVQQFELRRQASQLKKARVAKTGDLDMDKLWATKLTEDVFLSNTVIPQGKNHGMMFFIDFSGSMSRDIKATLEQVLIQSQFCKKVGIPFDVYSFTSGRMFDDQEMEYEKKQRLINEAQGGKKIDQLMINDDDMQINHLLSSSLSQRKYNDMFKTLLMVADTYGESRYWHRYYDEQEPTDLVFTGHRCPNVFQLGGTPLIETMVIATELVKKFRLQHKVEVMNTILLTDGGPTGNLKVECGTDKYFDDRGFSGYAINDKGRTIEQKNGRYWSDGRYGQYGLIKKWFRSQTDSRLINFHIGSFRKYDVEGEFNAKFGWAKGEKEFAKSWKQDWLKNGFVELTDFEEFDSKFLIKNGKALDIEDEELEVKSNKKGDLLRGFKKFQGNKTKQRVFVNRFIEKVA